MKLFRTKAPVEEVAGMGPLEHIINSLLPVTGDLYVADNLNNISETLQSRKDKYVSFTINASRYIPFVTTLTYYLLNQ